MPNKTIYVSEADLPMFERAQSLAEGNLSATISQALKRFVKEQEAAAEGYQTIEVKVGRVAHTSKRFIGRFLAKGHLPGYKCERPKTYKVYQTRKGNLAVHSHIAPDWSAYPFMAIGASQENRQNWADANEEYLFEVYESLDALKHHIPDELYDAVTQILEGNAVEELDI